MSKTKERHVLRERITVLVIATVLLSFLVNFLISTKYFGEYDQYNRENAFEEALRTINHAIDENRDALAKEAHLLGQLPVLNAVVNTKDPATIRDSIQTYHSDLNIPFIEILGNSANFITNVDGRTSLLNQDAYRKILSNEPSLTSLITAGDGVVVIAMAPVGNPPDNSGWIVLGKPIDNSFLKDINHNKLIDITLINAQGKIASTTRSEATKTSEDSPLIKKQTLLGPDKHALGTLLIEHSVLEFNQRKTDMMKAFLFYGAILLTIILFISSISATYLLRPLMRVSQRLSQLISADAFKKVADQKYSFTPGQGELRQTAVLFVDLRGFSDLSTRLNPNDVMAILTTYQSLVISTIDKFGGSVDKFMGDGIIIHFESTGSSVNYASNCMQALIALLNIFSEKSWSGAFPFEIKAVLACSVGTAAFGVVGNETRKEFTIIGNPVNVAAKLENHVKTLNLSNLASLEAYNLAVAQGFQIENVKIRKLHEKIIGINQSLDLVTFEL